MPLARAGQSEPLDIVWRPYELRPEGSPEPPPEYKEYVERSFRESVKPMSEELGLTMNLPTQQPQTRLTHEAVAFAVDNNVTASDAYITEVFKAYWEEDLDIGDIDVLCTLADRVDVDGAAMRQALENRDFNDYVTEKIELARAYGISAVPSLIVENKFLLRGLTSEEHLLKAIRQAKEL